MPKRRKRLTVAGLMLLVALAALLIAWFRPMTRREAARTAQDWVETKVRRGTLNFRPVPRGWEASDVSREDSGAYVVLVVSDGVDPECRLTVRVDPTTRSVSKFSVEFVPSRARQRPAPGPSRSGPAESLPRPSQSLWGDPSGPDGPPSDPLPSPEGNNPFSLGSQGTLGERGAFRSRGRNFPRGIWLHGLPARAGAAQSV